MFFETGGFGSVVEGREPFSQELESKDANYELERLIARLEKASFYLRSLEGEEEEILQSEQASFTIKRITDPEDPALLQMHELFFREFADEMDYFPYVKGWVKEEDISYHAVLDREQRVIAAANSSYLILDPANAESILAIWFMAVDKLYRSKRLANELYQDIYRFALNRSLEGKTKLKAIVGEASHKELATIEQVLNREEIGRKRVFYENKDRKFCEVPYVSLPLKYNLITGLPEEEVQPNHLMIRLLDGRQSMQVSEVVEMMRIIYAHSYAPMEGDFLRLEGFEQAKSIFDSYLKTIEARLAEAKDGEVFLLSAEERKQRLGKVDLR
ncbi:MAG TPA: GNAT family N-acetyltransferase [Candidatus Nanoarchaeia archaeon]|nr:GNAT family N-acetyltransferase [Candidatus Nanoarchaeia archaeon]